MRLTPHTLRLARYSLDNCSISPIFSMIKIFSLPDFPMVLFPILCFYWPVVYIYLDHLIILIVFSLCLDEFTMELQRQSNHEQLVSLIRIAPSCLDGSNPCFIV